MSQTPPPGSTAEQEHTEAIRRNYLIRFEEDTLRQRPLWIRLIIEFVGTAALVLVAAGSGVINQYVAGTPISRTAAVVAPGALVMALIYAWGPLSGLHINPAVTLAFAARGTWLARSLLSLPCVEGHGHELFKPSSSSTVRIPPRRGSHRGPGVGHWRGILARTRRQHGIGPGVEPVRAAR